MVDLIGSINDMFDKARVPDFIQMHAGDLDQTEIDEFSRNNPLVENQQTLDMLNIQGSTLYFNGDDSPQSSTVMDISFVTQSPSFDFLLDLDNEVLQVEPGYIGVPVYFMQENDLEIGDTVRVTDGEFTMEFTISDYVRDAQMNPSLVSSKRFVINQVDYDKLVENTGEIEYLVEFMLEDISAVDQFTNEYVQSGMPQKGPGVGGSMFKIMSALSDGIVVIIIVLISILLILVSVLCLRFTLLASIEEDYREIGVMKAIGILQKNIAKMYLLKYVLIAAAACVLGYILSLFLSDTLTANVKLYYGSVDGGLLRWVVPLLAVALVFAIIYLFCWKTLKRFKDISAVEAIRTGKVIEPGSKKSRFRIYSNNRMNVNALLGVGQVARQKKVYRMVLFIFFVCVFINTVPLNFYNTINSPGFLSYMGVGKSDMRIDLQLSEDIDGQFQAIASHLEGDEGVDKYTSYITCQYKVYNTDDNAYESLNVETGDFSVFPLEYVEGETPVTDREIALSSMKADGLGVGMNDTIQVMVDGTDRTLTICGIYQDVTNGGLSAKGNLPVDDETVQWYVISADFVENEDVEQKIQEYRTEFPSAKITDVNEYVLQSMGSVVEQTRLISILAFVLALALAVLITAMFLHMLISKESGDITIMKNLGFSSSDIQWQYVTRILVVLLGGILLGSIASKWLGELLVGGIMSFMGASKITFVINVLQTYIMWPLIMLIAVGGVTLIVSRKVEKINVSGRS